MVIAEEEIKKYGSTIGAERLKSFIYNENDTLDIVIERYKNNIKVSQALYPELSILEVTLRNAIDTMLKTNVSANWIEDEVQKRSLLLENEHLKLIRAYNEIKNSYSSRNFTTGKVIANLSLGFWTGLCSKKYNSILWTKKNRFSSVFVNFPADNKQHIHLVSIKLRSIRQLRNRIFHHEPIFKNPKALLGEYNNIMEVLSYLPCNDRTILKDTSNFLFVYNEALKNQKPRALYDKIVGRNL